MSKENENSPECTNESMPKSPIGNKKKRNHTHIVALAKEVESPDNDILTRTLFNNDDLNAVIFGFGPGQELSEHTASMPSILHFVESEATLKLG